MAAGSQPWRQAGRQETGRNWPGCKPGSWAPARCGARQGGEEGSGSHWGRVIPEMEASICWVRKLGEKDSDKSADREGRATLPGPGRSRTGVGSSGMEQGQAGQAVTLT